MPFVVVARRVVLRSCVLMAEMPVIKIGSNFRLILIEIRYSININNVLPTSVKQSQYTREILIILIDLELRN